VQEARGRWTGKVTFSKREKTKEGVVGTVMCAVQRKTSAKLERGLPKRKRDRCQRRGERGQSDREVDKGRNVGKK